MDRLMNARSDEKKIDNVPFSTHVPRELMQKWQAVTEANEYRKKKLTRKLIRMFLEWSAEEQEAFYDAPEGHKGLMAMVAEMLRDPKLVGELASRVRLELQDRGTRLAAQVADPKQTYSSAPDDLTPKEVGEKAADEILGESLDAAETQRGTRGKKHAAQ